MRKGRSHRRSRTPADARATATGAADRLAIFDRYPEAIVFVVALAARLAHVVALSGSPFFDVLIGDAREYDEWARRLAAGDWLGSDVFYQAPLYPYFLGGVYALLGRDLFIVRCLQALIGAAGCAMLARAGRHLFSPRVGLAAGLTLALYAPALFWDGLIQKSTLDAFFICLVLWLTATLIEDPNRPARWLGLGVALGALGLTRENALALAIVALPWTVVGDIRNPADRDRRRVVTRAASLVFGLTVVLAPVVVRNYALGGGFLVSTSQLGSNLFIGNNPAADGTYMALREGRGDPAYERADARALAEQALGRTLTPAEISAYWRDRALAYVRSQPVGWLRLLARKARLLTSDTEMLDTEAQQSHSEWSPLLRAAGLVGRFGVLLPLAGVGLCLTWADRRRLWILHTMVLAYAASVLAFFVVARYRYPLVPMLVLFAVAGVARVRDLVRSDRHRALAMSAIVALVVALAAWSPALSAASMRAITETNLGAALQGDGRLDEAAAAYRRALLIDADYAPAYNNLGVTLRAQGKLDEAIDAYRTALARRPDYPEVHYNLAAALLERNEPAEAVVHFRVARTSIPPTAAAHNNFGLALAAVGRVYEAMTEFRAALAAQPDFPQALKNLGESLADAKQYPEALEYLRRLTELQPDNPAAHYDLGNVLMEAGRLSEAAAAHRAAIRLAPQSAQAHSKLGIALGAQGQMDDAIAEFTRALQLDPELAEARRFLEMARRSR